MMIRAIVKRPDEMTGHVTYISNKLETLQKNVGGYIECVTIRPGVAIICNEEGRLLELPYNCEVEGYQTIGDNNIKLTFFRDFVGDIMVVGVDGDEFCDLPAEVTRKEWATWIVK